MNKKGINLDNDIGLVHYVIKSLGLNYIKDEIIDVGYIGLCRGYKTLNPEISRTKYLCTCIKNEIITHLKKRNIEGVCSLNKDINDEGDELGDFIPDERINVEKEAYGNIRKEKLREAIDKLKPTYRTIIIDYYYKGFSIDEIAKGFGISRQATNVKIRLAEQKIKKELEKEENKKWVGL